MRSVWGNSRKYFSALSESEKTKFWDKTTPRFNRFNSFCTDEYKNQKGLTEAMFNNQLVTKGLLLNGSSKVRNAILSSGDAALIKDYKAALAHAASDPFR